MAKKTTYNGRFIVPDEPSSGSKWLIGGLLAIPFWSIPVLGMGVLAASICCFVKAGKMNSKRRMYRRFHEFCAVIGMRERVPIRELAKVAEMGKNEMRTYLQRMIAEGYFGEGAILDVNRDELILPKVPGYEQPRTRADELKDMVFDWKDMVFDLLGSLRSELVHDGQHSAPKAEAKPEPVQKEEAKPQPGHAPQPQNSRADELERNLNALYELNEKIEDEAVSRRIDRIGTLTAGIFRAVIDNPDREQDVRKFMNYYLPTTLKLLQSYEMLEEQSYQGENIIASRKKIENVLDMLIEAFEKQLDRLFKNDALDIAADIDVLETMIAGDGLSSKDQMGMYL